jgi:hypothetical protein
VFFNAAEDSPEVLRDFVRGRIEAIRESHRATLREIISGANALLVNYEKEQTREVMAGAARRLTIWIDHNSEVAVVPSIHVQDSLLSAVGSAHPRTIHASVVRDGDWQNLNYAHQLSHGARRIATQVVEPKLTAFREIATNLLDDEQYSDARDLIRQTVRVMESGFDGMVRKAQLVGQSIHADEMRTDAEFWQDLSHEWGCGSGYRDRINTHNRKWFLKGNHGEADNRVAELVREQWGQTVVSIRELLP